MSTNEGFLGGVELAPPGDILRPCPDEAAPTIAADRRLGAGQGNQPGAIVHFVP